MHTCGATLLGQGLARKAGQKNRTGPTRLESWSETPCLNNMLSRTQSSAQISYWTNTVIIPQPRGAFLFYMRFEVWEVGVAHFHCRLRTGVTSEDKGFPK